MRKHPFTLAELMVALLLMGILVAGLFTATGGITNTWEDVLISNQEFQELVDIEKVLDNSLPNIVPFVWRDAEIPTQRKSCFSGQQNAVSFTCLHKCNNLDDGAIRFMAILQEEDELVVYYKNRPFINLEELDQDEQLSRVVMADRIEEVTFSYAHAEEDAEDETIEWVEEWDDDDEKRFDVPLAVRMDITWQDQRSESFLYRTAGNSQFQRWGNWKYYKFQGGSEAGSTDGQSGGSGNNTGNSNNGSKNSGKRPGGF